MSTTTEVTVADLVAEEATRLDRLYPGWEEKIDLSTLSLWAMENCVLGQITGDWETAFENVRADGYEPQCVYADAERYQDFWVQEIQKRL